MIAKSRFRHDFENLIKQLEPRKLDEDLLDRIKWLDDDLISRTQELNDLKCQKTTLSNNIRKCMMENAHYNSTVDDQNLRYLKSQITSLTKEWISINSSLDSFIYEVPNIPAPDLTDQQKIIYSKNTDKINKFEFGPKTHVELAEQLSLISFDYAVSIIGSGFATYVGKGEKLYRALISFTLDENEKKGYLRHYVPELVSQQSLLTTSQMSKFANQIFKLPTGHCLSPTGEVQLVNLYKDKIIESKKLPIKLTTHTNCFRNESISAGSENRGIIRLYQFSKTEIVTICKEEDSAQILEQMCLDAEDLLIQLNLPYRKVLLANHDLGFSSHKTYDLEVWLPSEGKYREISSISNTLDFQSIRGKIRWKDQLLNKEEKTKFVHILNGSSLAIDRLFAAIIENYQDADGNVEIPEKLIKYLDFSKIEI